MTNINGNSFMNGVEFISSERVDKKDTLNKINDLKQNAKTDGLNNLIASEKSSDGSETTTVSNFKLDNTSFTNVDFLKKALIEKGNLIEFIDSGADDKQIPTTSPVNQPANISDAETEAIYNKISAIQLGASDNVYNNMILPRDAFKFIVVFNAIKENKDNGLDENSLNQSIERVKSSTKRPVELFKYVLSYTKNPLPIDQPPDAVSHMLSARWQPKNYEDMKKDFIEFTGLKKLTDRQFCNILSNFEGYCDKSYGVTCESLIEHSGLKHIAKSVSEK